MEDKSRRDDSKFEKISRKEAMKKAGKYAVFTAGSMLFFFSPKQVQASSFMPEAAESTFDGWE
jgi:hypothetical protein